MARLYFLFRQMARLDKKNDARLSSYFKEFIAMCKRVCGRATDEEIVQGLIFMTSLIGTCS